MYLSQRQQQIITLMAEGKTQGQIAGELGITIKTVKFHLTHAYKAAGVKSGRQLVYKMYGPQAPSEMFSIEDIRRAAMKSMSAVRAGILIRNLLGGDNETKSDK